MATFNGTDWTFADFSGEDGYKYAENWDQFWDDVIAEMDDRRTELGASKLDVAGDGSAVTVMPTGGTTAQSLAALFGRVVYLEAMGAVGNGIANDRPAFAAALARIQAMGGGRIVGKHGATYRLDYTSGALTTLATLTDCRGVHFDMPGSTIQVDRTFTGSEYFDLIRLAGCYFVDIDIGHIIGAVQPRTEQYQRGWRSFYLYGTATSGGCQHVRSRFKQTGGINTLFIWRDPTDPASYNSRYIDVDIEAIGVGYGLNLASAGSNVTGRVRCDGCWRSFIAYGVEDIDLDISDKNHTSHSCKMGANTTPAILRNVRINYLSEDRTVDEAGGFCVDFELRSDTPILLENIDVTITCKDAGYAQRGGFFGLRKTLADGTVDTTARGHIVRNVKVRGIIDGVQDVAAWSWAPNVVEVCKGWGTGDYVDNIEVGPFVVTGNTGSVIYVDAATIRSGLHLHDIRTVGSVTVAGTLPPMSQVARVTDKNGTIGWQAAAPALLPDGSASAPAVAFSADTNTGLYRLGSDKLGLATGGAVRTVIDSAGALIQGHTTGLSIGAGGGQSPQVQTHGTGFNTGIGSCRWDAASVFGAQLTLAHSRGAIGTHGALVNGDECGCIWFTASDGTTFMPAADIRGWIDGTPSAGYMPGMLVFGTTATGGGSPVERLRISGDGTMTHRNNGTTIVNASSHLCLRAYTFATLPSASPAQQNIAISDRGNRPAWSTGSAWIWADGTTVS
ncbi:hypothetical protein J2848_005704 [Azospirillum lipoferum]|uniref:Uncharacterized protein n=1 Tax=Azospirillum lipoferum TaxID=193 RepID=A0A5A9GEV9_AZOLI|nr:MULTISPECIES: hypothetical protein [Azospirillum]KAA0592940.1 hypothetical protein FZ942_25795 [Azospirillum lipoferum]MCP1614003.1 hypothetical protein [Azospirillum lipoferum]MDW5537605.1 hypothetical protein [Azospirillum sp. NL1]